MARDEMRETPPDDGVPETAVVETVPETENGPTGPVVFFVHFERYSANHGQMLAVADALYAEGWDVHILCRASCRILPEAEARLLPVHPVPDTAGKGFFSAWSLLRLIRKQTRKHGGSRQKNAETRVLLHACDPLASQVVSTLWRLDKKLRLVHTRRLPIMESNAKTLRCYQTPPAKIITDSLAGKIALRLSGMEPHLLHTIACGFAGYGQPLRRERGDGRMIFGVTGDLVPDRGHSLLFAALAILKQTPGLPPWEARILGEGPHFHALLDEARAGGVDEHLAFLGGVDQARQLAECDVLVLPAGDGESHMPLILQGWAARVPVIAVNRLDHAENLQEDVNCVLVQPGDAGGLAERMIRLAKDSELRSILASGGRASLAKFDVGVMTLEHKRLYSQILA